MYFLKNLLLYSGAWFRQTKCIVIMTKEGSTKIVNFMTPGAGVLVLGHGHTLTAWVYSNNVYYILNWTFYSFVLQYLILHVFTILEDIILLGIYQPRARDQVEIDKVPQGICRQKILWIPASTVRGCMCVNLMAYWHRVIVIFLVYNLAFLKSYLFI